MSKAPGPRWQNYFHHNNAAPIRELDRCFQAVTTAYFLTAMCPVLLGLPSIMDLQPSETKKDKPTPHIGCNTRSWSPKYLLLPSTLIKPQLAAFCPMVLILPSLPSSYAGFVNRNLELHQLTPAAAAGQGTNNNRVRCHHVGGLHLVSA